MENHLYTCHYCSKQFEPKRRRIQKFCKASCRAGYHRLKNKSTLPIKTTTNSKIEKMSLAGVGNAALGSLSAEVFKNAFISKENKPATKKDIAELKKSLQRYHPVKNLPIDIYQGYPFFDILEGKIKYFKNPI